MHFFLQIFADFLLTHFTCESSVLRGELEYIYNYVQLFQPRMARVIVRDNDHFGPRPFFQKLSKGLPHVLVDNCFWGTADIAFRDVNCCAVCAS